MNIRQNAFFSTLLPEYKTAKHRMMISNQTKNWILYALIMQIINGVANKSH